MMRDDNQNKILFYYGFRIALLAILVSVLVILFYYILRTSLEILTAAEPDVVTAIMGAFGVVTVALVANIWSKQIENRQQVRRERRTRKAEVYEDFIKFWRYVLTEEEGATPQLKKDLKDHVSDPTPQITTWGSEAFLEEYVAFRNVLDKDRDAALAHFEKVLLAIREDLGYSDSGLAQGDLLKAFLDAQSADNIVVKGETAPAHWGVKTDEQIEED